MKPLPLPHPRTAVRLGVVAVAISAPGCLVSFDGYRLDPETGGVSRGGAEVGGASEGGTAAASGWEAVRGGEGGSPGSGLVAGGGESDAGRPAGGASTGNEPRGAASPGGEGGVPESETGGLDSGGSGEGGGGDGGNGGDGEGGHTGDGGSTGGATSGGHTMGGTGATGGLAPGGANTGGDVTGDTGGTMGGNAAGGAGTGGIPTGGTGTGGHGTGGGMSCPVGLPGPAMTEVPKGGGGFFCIDRTEVTNAQYAAFVAAADTAGQPVFCSFNTNFTPQTSTDCPSLRYDPTEFPEHPVSCVDWCDAHAFCAWAKKRLCGNVAGGPVAPEDFADATSDQWYRACTGGGDTAYPYGSTHEAARCVDMYSPAAYPVPIGEFPNCHGQDTFADIFDQSGNVSEWEDSCSASAGGSDLCMHRGGSYLDAEDTFPSVRCDSADEDNLVNLNPAQRERQSRSITVGFRCCWDP
ncbi:MAG: SUMF1/EgtB/PvdO family nonheme iron enzyme [Polyangiaceae bacterium]|nr:SUMF1/EgtB/PvdO family nonheme iron enzyme [Polyangiaceae bacterium]